MSSPLRPGDRLAGYRIERELGHGATGVVYLARQEALDRPVALKVAGAPLATDTAFRERFRHEAQAAAGLDHPNVVTVLDSGADDEHLWLAMRLVDGPDLRVLLRRTGRLEPEQAVSVVEQVAAALDAAHAAGLVHRDVKPGNVLIEDGPGRELHVELADFGLVRPSGAATPEDPEGTPGYAAPEQLAGEDASAAVDVFGLGCVLYELLTGIPPTPVAARAATGDRLPPRESYVHREGLRPSDGLPALGVAFDRIVLAATAPDPAARPASAGEVAVAARAALEAPRAAPPASAAEVRAAAAIPATPGEMAIPPDHFASDDEYEELYEDDELEPQEVAAVTTLVAPPRAPRRSWFALGLFAVVVLAVLVAAFFAIGPLGPAEQARVVTKGAMASGGAAPRDLTGRSATVGGSGVRGTGGTRPRATAGGAGGTGAGTPGGAAASGAGSGASAGGADAATARGSAGTGAAGGSGGGATAPTRAGAGSATSTGSSGRSRASIPVVSDAAPGAGPARTRPAPAAGDERFGGGGWSLDLPAAEGWRQTAVQERDGGRRLVTRLLRPDGARLILEYRPGGTAVFGFGPALPFRVRPVGGGRVEGSLFRGGRYAPCRRGVCAAVPLNGADGGVLLVAAAAEPDVAQRLAVRAVRGLRVR